MDSNRYLAPTIYSLISITIFITIAQAICVPIGSSRSDPAPTPKPSYTLSQDSDGSPLKDITGKIGDLLHSAIANNPLTGNLDPALMKMCNATDNQELCITELVPLLNGKNDADSVIRMAVKAASDYTNLALMEAEKLAADPSISSRLAGIFTDCKDSYSDALDNFQEALQSLPAKDSGTMGSMLSAAITDFSDIDDFLEGYTTTLPEYNAKLVKLTSNCINVTSEVLLARIFAATTQFP
ncbi:uncharacterized protein LOC124912884 [Impatiens glandulifera]|uniref:uncharacterized protein LOC124912884 n=1 Tax=Impatiens glandulifera TaxID=253017 RepID=UPI001FB062CD|nr:uncharacterized protein LOC124912884 [Impatiens glandulifera]